MKAKASFKGQKRCRVSYLFKEPLLYVSKNEKGVSSGQERVEERKVNNKFKMHSR